MVMHPSSFTSFAAETPLADARIDICALATPLAISSISSRVGGSCDFLTIIVLNGLDDALSTIVTTTASWPSSAVMIESMLCLSRDVCAAMSSLRSTMKFLTVFRSEPTQADAAAYERIVNVPQKSRYAPHAY